MAVITSPANPCVVSSFTNPSVFGAEILAINAAPVSNFTLSLPSVDIGVSNPPTVEFCNVTVTYTHPGQNDKINVETWLPLQNWNGKLQSVGGGGWVAGRGFLSQIRMLGPIAEGYITTSTDAGQDGWSGLDAWVLLSQGNINLHALQNLGLVSLNDTAFIAKSLSSDYYGRAPSYSYWNGCSQGGRQGIALAQRFPTAYDGIFANAPAIHWAELIASSLWPVAFMQFTNQYPKGCELTQLTSLAKTVCDELDGVRDGLIGDPEACREAFNPESYIGTSVFCDETGSEIQITSTAASVASAIWDGPKFSDGRFIWYGFDIGTDITPLAQSICSDDGKCYATATPSISTSIRYFVDKDVSSNVTMVSHEDFDHLYRTIKNLFASNLQTGDPDVTEFRNAGGKILTYHGLVSISEVISQFIVLICAPLQMDEAIPSQGTLHYYKMVNETLGGIQDCYRYFRVPGLRHCWGGIASEPALMFNQLVSWVEESKEPTHSKVTFAASENSTSEGIICAWPQKPVLSPTCNFSSATEDCWSCSI
ncbi:feruloyl esterase-like protein 2 [Colletotrichum truncatum]|uniref:Feruloyl esterase-like protein 2 n=1 Tax=Colletotrichum truncatum TaxID=5467 RepID=A0ACC3ZD71_COLTU|nr:feruloyl esterase-like protein 2 [Colletotrichum truncatum]KAF6798011.1 feruloyl esterase-like protein 2 [Colletotrichum truncatum]